MAKIITPENQFNLTCHDLVAGAVYEHKSYGFIMACNTGDSATPTFAVRLSNGARVDIINRKLYRKIPTITLES